MKKLIISTLIICFGFNISFAQNIDSTFSKSKFKGDINEYFGKRLRLSPEKIMNGYKGKAVLSFRIDKKGILDSIEILDYSDIKLAKYTASLVAKTKNMWMPTILNGDTIAYTYKLIVQCVAITDESSNKDLSLSCKENAEKLLRKKQYQSALLSITTGISLNPYIADYYLIRSKCYKLLDKPEDAEKDYQSYKTLERDIAGVIDIRSYATTVRSRYR
jgi:tetratricopeptide (TPR) repeat protein